MQGFGARPSPIGIIYITSMHRPDAALALAELYAFETKGESTTVGVCVAGGGLNAAVFCDIVARFFTGSPREGNQQLPVGLAAAVPLPSDPAMIQAAVERKNDKGELLYRRSVRRVSDTSQAEAMIRNAVTFNKSCSMVLSAPATSLAKTLDLLGVSALYKQYVQRLVIVDFGEAQRDVPALRKILAEFPAPIFFLGKEVGDALPFPGGSIDKDFLWAVDHPVVDAYRAARKMPYDASSYDLAAIHNAVHPTSGLFQESAPGNLSVLDDGSMRFTEGGGGKARRLVVDVSKQQEILKAFVAIVSSKPKGRG